MCVNSERKPHKHAELIKAWADGAVIQFYDVLREKWRACDEAPRWLDNNLYRIKPEGTDLEKYGVEVGDVWMSGTGWSGTISRPDIGSGMYLTLGGYKGTHASLKSLLFRRGVVNRL